MAALQQQVSWQLADYLGLTPKRCHAPFGYTSWYSSIASSSFNVSGSTMSLASSASLDTFVHSSNSMFWMMYGGGRRLPKHGLDLAREPCDGLRDRFVGFIKLSLDAVAHVILHT